MNGFIILDINCGRKLAAMMLVGGFGLPNSKELSDEQSASLSLAGLVFGITHNAAAATKSDIEQAPTGDRFSNEVLNRATIPGFESSTVCLRMWLHQTLPFLCTVVMPSVAPPHVGLKFAKAICLSFAEQFGQQVTAAPAEGKQFRFSKKSFSPVIREIIGRELRLCCDGKFCRESDLIAFSPQFPHLLSTRAFSNNFVNKGENESNSDVNDAVADIVQRGSLLAGRIDTQQATLHLRELLCSVHSVAGNFNINSSIVQVGETVIFAQEPGLLGATSIKTFLLLEPLLQYISFSMHLCWIHKINLFYPTE